MSPNAPTFNQRRAYELSRSLRLNHWALAGEWTIRPEYVLLDHAGGSIAFRFHARDAHVVLARGGHLMARDPSFAPAASELGAKDPQRCYADSGLGLTLYETGRAAPSSHVTIGAFLLDPAVAVA